MHLITHSAEPSVWNFIGNKLSWLLFTENNGRQYYTEFPTWKWTCKCSNQHFYFCLKQHQFQYLYVKSLFIPSIIVIIIISNKKKWFILWGIDNTKIVFSCKVFQNVCCFLVFHCQLFILEHVTYFAVWLHFSHQSGNRFSHRFSNQSGNQFSDWSGNRSGTNLVIDLVVTNLVINPVTDLVIDLVTDLVIDLVTDLVIDLIWWSIW